MISNIAIAYGLNEVYKNADQCHKIIIGCAAAATAIDGIGGLIPGLAIPATILSCVGVVWTMYISLCKALGITLQKNTLKVLARGALSNVASNLTGALMAGIAAQLIPGVSGLASAAIGFISVYLAGVIFLRMIAKLAKKSADPTTFSDISEKEMKDTVHNIKVTKDDLNEAKEEFKTSQTTAA